MSDKRSSDFEEDFKPKIAAQAKGGRKRKLDAGTGSGVGPPAKRGRKPNDPNSPSKTPSSRTDAPAFTPGTCDPPINNARDPRLTVALIERLIDDCSVETRKALCEEFGIKPDQFRQAWGDTMKFKAKRVFRQGMLGA